MRTQLQIARLLGVDKSTIFRLCRANGIEPSEIDRNGTQLYNDDTVDIIRNVLGDQTAKKAAIKKRNDANALQEYCATLQKTIAEHESNIAGLRKELAEAKADRDSWRKQAEELQKSNSELTRSNADLTKNNSDLSETVGTLQYILRLPWWRRRKALLALPAPTKEER